MRFSHLSTIALLSLLSFAVASPSWSQTSAPGKAGAEPAPGKADPSAAPAAPTDAPEDVQQSFGPRVQAPPDGAQGQGQDQQPAGPPPTIVGTYGNWQVQCTDAPAGAEGAPAKQCGMVQGTQSEKDPEVGLSLIIVLAKEGDKTMTMMRVLVPVGVYLPTGVALEVDGAAVGRVPFTRCLPQVCEAFAEASPETLAKLKKGKTANFIIYEAPGLGMPLKIELKGFAEGLDTLGKQS